MKQLLEFRGFAMGLVVGMFLFMFLFGVGGIANQANKPTLEGIDRRLQAIERELKQTKAIVERNQAENRVWFEAFAKALIYLIEKHKQADVRMVLDNRG